MADYLIAYLQLYSIFSGNIGYRGLHREIIAKWSQGLVFIVGSGVRMKENSLKH